MARVRHGLIEIDHPVELLRVANPGVHLLANPLVLRRTERDERSAEECAFTRRKRRDDDFDALPVRPLQELAIGSDQCLCARRFTRRDEGAGEEDVVDAEGQDDELDAGLLQNVAVETRKA